jgi:hypothetical protein
MAAYWIDKTRVLFLVWGGVRYDWAGAPGAPEFPPPSRFTVAAAPPDGYEGMAWGFTRYKGIEIDITVVPVWWLAAALLGATALAWKGPVLLFLRRRRGACPACGYDRRGLSGESPCPECGTTPARG